ncbi:nicotinate-nucleotide adenylyltransferase [Desulfurobacterium atlanticum]|uniref:Probable nicotinate-nucleotide adenylyltransferase n=1 Tax=Desulfurobacterium atlanticum TaxID=240169 RepID=A0A239A2T3_9BACT|nr:nicotinate-nucleotide adenylyltransferase [Desulfurobacterium atlanticum]SNR89428.1 nicotinate-nucleotide adenylyltransferase [Desulfurobacterium atlanticum]
MKEALFGGSFNPVHIGHLVIARDVLESFGFDKIVFVPAKIQPLKGKLSLPSSLRLKLLETATADIEYFSVWDYEIRKDGVSYTVDTLKEYVRIKGKQPVFIMGGDSFSSLHLWKSPEKILEIAKIIVVKRPGREIDISKLLGEIGVKKVVKFSTVKEKNSLSEADIFVLDGRLIEISSTEIRKRLEEKKDIRFLVPDRCISLLKQFYS